MTRNHNLNYTQMLSRLLLGLLLGTIPLAAQTADESRLGRGFGAVYDAARETTVNGTIQQVVTQYVPGSSTGMHLLVSGSYGLVDVHMGPLVSRQTIQALRTGKAVQIWGAVSLLHGQSYFLARQLKVDGHTFTLRTPTGLPVYGNGQSIGKSSSAPPPRIIGGTQ